MNTEENTMNIEEEIKQVWHEDSVRLWAEQYGKLNTFNEMMKLVLAEPEPDRHEAVRLKMATDEILSFGGVIPSELGWKQFAIIMPNLAKELKENYDKLKSKVLSSPVKIMSLKPDWARKEDERQARKAKLPWYKRLFV